MRLTLFGPIWKYLSMTRQFFFAKWILLEKKNWMVLLHIMSRFLVLSITLCHFKNSGHWMSVLRWSLLKNSVALIQVVMWQEVWTECYARGLLFLSVILTLTLVLDTPAWFAYANFTLCCVEINLFEVKWMLSLFHSLWTARHTQLCMTMRDGVLSYGLMVLTCWLYT